MDAIEGILLVDFTTTTAEMILIEETPVEGGQERPK
jgi:hypothetical protein